MKDYTKDYTKEDLAELLLLISNGNNNLKLKDYYFLLKVNNLTAKEIAEYLKKIIK